jgi:hypothetical protein
VLVYPGPSEFSDKASLVPTFNYLNNSFVGEGLALPYIILKDKHLNYFLTIFEM